jgi:raffinose/stachyose/melibiose transport system permease protein
VLSDYLWALPALILVVGVIHAGIAANAFYSLFDWSGVGSPTDFVGGTNYSKLLQDPVFWQALRNTLVFAAATVAIQLVLGLALAVLVRTRVRLRGLLRTLVFVPVVLAPAVVATSFRILLTPDGGFNHLLQGLGLSGFDQAWLADPKTAFGTIILINVWQYTGYSFLIYDAAIGQIDHGLFEAARIDGATSWQLIRAVVAPMLRGSHLVLIVLGFISALKMFDLVFLTTAGGPGTTTQVLTGYIYKQVIAQFHAGYGAALSIVLVLIALGFSILQVRLSTSESR